MRGLVGARSLIAVRLGLVALVAGSGPLIASTPSQAASFTTVTTAYGSNADSQALTVYEPPTEGPHPAILFVHGGCWARGDLNSAETTLAQDLAERTGWVVATMTYRVTSSKWSTMPADVNAALRLLQTGGFGVDTNRVAVWGESAGGQLGLLDALKGTGAAGLGRPKAVVSISGPVDMRSELGSGAQAMQACVEGFENGLPISQAMVNRYLATSPVNWVDVSDPAVFMGSSTADTMVPPSQTSELESALDEAGVPVTVALVPGDDHSTAAEHDTVAGSSLTLEQTAINWLADQL